MMTKTMALARGQEGVRQTARDTPQAGGDASSESEDSDDSSDSSDFDDQLRAEARSMCALGMCSWDILKALH